MVEPTYDSYEAKVAETTVALVAQSATFQTLVGAINATAARAFIVENEGGLQSENADPDGKDQAIAVDGTAIDTKTAHAFVDAGEVNQEPGVVFSYRPHNGLAIVRIVIPATANDEPSWRRRRVLNTLGGIKADMVAVQGTGSYFINMGIETVITRTADDGDSRQKTEEGELLITWSDL